LSAGSLYYHWDNQADYADALLDYVLHEIETTRSEALEGHLKYFLGQLDAGKAFDEAVRGAGDSLFSFLVKDQSFLVQMGMWASQGSNPEVASRLSSMYEKIEKRWMPGFQEVLRRQSRVMREPFDLPMFATIVIALAEGLLLRERVDAEAVTPIRRRDCASWSVFSAAVLAFYLVTTVPIGERNTDIRDLAHDRPTSHQPTGFA
jgi:hypothetical protein